MGPIQTIKFNMEKSKVLHLGRKNQRYKYRLGETWLKNSNCERNLGVLVDNRLNMNQQCAATTKKANSILSCINRGIKSNCDILVQLYESLVRPFLEYCIQIWSPHYKKDVEILEKMQRRELQ
uniref:Uncharacterized protein n=1 Tax=Micrurus paraensis TaxID=1970185 RepID=A0A2D4L5K5_9SAUR